MRYFDRIKHSIEEGQKGYNRGLPMGFNRLVEHIPNIQKGTYYLIGASTGAGKTSLVNDAFVFNPYDAIADGKTDLKMTVDYFSFEIDTTTMLLNALRRRIFVTENKVVTLKELLNFREEYTHSEDLKKSIARCEGYISGLEKVLTIHDIPNTPDQIIAQIEAKAASLGKYVDGRYVPNDPLNYWIIVIDHISLLKGTGGGLKFDIDKLSDYFIFARNNYKCVPVVIQQLTFDVTDQNRAKLNNPSPVLGDFGDSKYTTRAANIVLAIFDPMLLHLTAFAGYEVEKLKGRLRLIEVLKNRIGKSGVRIGMHFKGEVGTFKELPRADDMKPEDYQRLSL